MGISLLACFDFRSKNNKRLVPLNTTFSLEVQRCDVSWSRKNKKSRGSELTTRTRMMIIIGLSRPLAREKETWPRLFREKLEFPLNF